MFKIFLHDDVINGWCLSVPSNRVPCGSGNLFLPQKIGGKNFRNGQRVEVLIWQRGWCIKSWARLFGSGGWDKFFIMVILSAFGCIWELVLLVGRIFPLELFSSNYFQKWCIFSAKIPYFGQNLAQFEVFFLIILSKERNFKIVEIKFLWNRKN